MGNLFIILSKLIPALIYPVSLACLCLFIALNLRSRARLRRFLVFFAFMVLFICGNRFPAALMTRWLETRYAPFDGKETAEFVVVLGGCTETKSAPRQMVEVNSAADRIIYGSQLYLQGYANKMLVGGSYIDWLDGDAIDNSGKGSSPAQEMSEIAQMLGVPKHDIEIQNKSLNTYQEAIEDAAILHEYGVTKIILVTSATHMVRSVGVFEKQGLEVIPAPADFGYTDKEWEELKAIDWMKLYTYILPSANNISGFQTAMKEYLGILVYKIRGWM